MSANAREPATDLQHAYALGLARDPEFVREHAEFSQRYALGEFPDEGMTAEEFADRYLAAR